jgi:hypothetical protein
MISTNFVLTMMLVCMSSRRATREQQVALAKHMAHNVTTADRYYDKSEWREARHECLDDIQTNIMVSTKLVDIIKRQH